MGILGHFIEYKYYTSDTIRPHPRTFTTYMFCNNITTRVILHIAMLCFSDTDATLSNGRVNPTTVEDGRKNDLTTEILLHNGHRIIYCE